MEKLFIDPSDFQQLIGLDRSVELCDLGGRSLGWFLPALGRADYDGYECPLTSEELNQIEQAGGGRPLSEILADLQQST